MYACGFCIGCRQQAEVLAECRWLLHTLGAPGLGQSLCWPFFDLGGYNVLALPRPPAAWVCSGSRSGQPLSPLDKLKPPNSF